jgi:hypothetical protein
VTQVTSQGPGGYPKAPYGSFSGRVANKGTVSLLGAGGYPRAPYGSFAGRAPAPTVAHNDDNPFFCHVGRLMGHF